MIQNNLSISKYANQNLNFKAGIVFRIKQRNPNYLTNEQSNDLELEN